jgi:glycopeptide antibiotics resistance protein
MEAPFKSSSFSGAPGWSNRILILSLIGIVFLTLMPFRFTLYPNLPAGKSPLLLNGWQKEASALDAFLNVLLFIPFGFAIAEKSRERGRSWRSTLFRALVSGALLSYTIEFIQLFIPMRDSGWQDLVTNTAGSVAGFVLFDVYGGAALQALSAAERAFEQSLRWPRTMGALALYFALWLAISVPLQMQTRISNWNPDSLLALGNDINGAPSTAWKGHLFRVQIWNRAVPAETARKLSRGEPAGETRGLLGDYDFSQPSQLMDRRNFLPQLSWSSNAPGISTAGDPPYLALDGRSWVITSEPVPQLITSMQKTNQFAVRIVCEPGETLGADGRIFGISEQGGRLELRIRQENAKLIIFFSNPLSVKHSDLVWYFDDFFERGRVRDIIYSYDGSSASLFLDGIRVERSYRLGPGTALARLFRLVRTHELNGYSYIYYFLVFFPGGAIMGIAARKPAARSNFAARALLASGCILLPPLLLEFVLVSVSGRGFSPGYPMLSALLAIGGSLWINSDGQYAAR